MSAQNPVLPTVAARAVWQRDKPLSKSEAARPHLHPGEAAHNVERMQSFSELVSPRLDLGDAIIGMRDLQSSGRLYEIEPIPSEAADQQHILKTHESIVEAICELMPERRMDPMDHAVFSFTTKPQSGAILEACARLPEYPRREETAIRITGSERCMRIFRTHRLKEECFRDDQQAPWRARKRRLRLCVWRRTQPGESHNPTDNLKYVTERVENGPGTSQVAAKETVRSGSLRLADPVVCAEPQWAISRRGIRNWPVPTSPASALQGAAPEINAGRHLVVYKKTVQVHHGRRANADTGDRPPNRGACARQR